MTLLNARLLDLLYDARLLDIDKRSQAIKMVELIDEAIHLLRTASEDK